MTRCRRWLFWGGIFTLVVIGGVAFLSTIVSPYPDIEQTPVEANRVRHPWGFSIIKPGRTRAIIRDDTITILPDGGHSRLTPVLSARRLSDPPNPATLQRDQFQAGKFQNQEAYVYVGPSGKYDAYRAITRRGGFWYEITLLIPQGTNGSGPMPSTEWRRYLDSFNVAGVVPVTTRTVDNSGL